MRGLALLLAVWQVAQGGAAVIPARPEAAQPEVARERDEVWPSLPRVPAAQALREGVQWLVEHQNPDGSWGSHHSARPIEVLASPPGSQEAFRVATTALCVMALRDAALDLPGVREAIAKGVDHLLLNYDVKRQSGLEHYNVWAFGYGLECLGKELALHTDDERGEELRQACKKLVQRLGEYQTLDGGWGYLSISGVPTQQPSDTSMSFTTATILLGLYVAGEEGVAIPERLLQRALQEVERSRLSDDAFLYGDYLRYVPRHEINERFGSACRTPLCLLALEKFGRPVEEKTYVSALDNLLVRGASYQKSGVRRPIPHESWYAISGYFYLYGHAYAAYALEKLSPETQARLWPLIVDAVQYCRDPDGSFWDYPLYSYHKPYGTAFAVLALSRAVKAGIP